jgi:hypothetical protein
VRRRIGDIEAALTYGLNNRNSKKRYTARYQNRTNLSICSSPILKTLNVKSVRASKKSEKFGLIGG